MEKQDKIFIGSGKLITTKTGFKFLSQSICFEDAEPYLNEAKNGKHYLNFSAVPKKSVDQYGNTHYLAINKQEGEYKKEEKKVEEDKPQKEIDEEELSRNTCVEEDDYIDPNEIPF